MSRPRQIFCLIALLAALGTGACGAHAAAPPQVQIAGNHFVDGAGRTLRLIGTSAGIGSAEACTAPTYGEPHRVASHSVFYGPFDDATIAAIASWHINTVRVSINEDCWLGINPVRNLANRIRVERGRGASGAGARLAARYRTTITDFIGRLHAAGMITIVDLHVTAPGRTVAFAQWPLPDASHSPAVWRSLVETFRDDRAMIFEVFNEPFDQKGQVTWECLRDGCRLPNGCTDCNAPDANTRGCSAKDCPTFRRPAGAYAAAGMQSLVNQIRSAGATQPLLAPGLAYSDDLSRWLEFRPVDPLGQLGASFHWYTENANDQAGCTTVACWDQVIAPIASQVPVVTTEFGQFDCAHDRMDAYQEWADARGVSYLAFGWYAADTPPCQIGLPTMIADDAGTPSSEGIGFHDHLATLAARGELP